MCGLHNGDTDLKLYFLLGETVKREKEREREEGEMTENSGHIKTQQSVQRLRAGATVLCGAPRTDRALVVMLTSDAVMLIVSLLV